MTYSQVHSLRAILLTDNRKGVGWLRRLELLPRCNRILCTRSLKKAAHFGRYWLARTTSPKNYAASRRVEVNAILVILSPMMRQLCFSDVSRPDMATAVRNLSPCVVPLVRRQGCARPDPQFAGQSQNRKRRAARAAWLLLGQPQNRAWPVVNRRQLLRVTSAARTKR